MITTTNSIKTIGTNHIQIKVECEISAGNGIHLVGLAGAAVKESLLRTVRALEANGYILSRKKITINLAPADLCKSGSAYDLPIALAVIAASGQAELPELNKWLIVGELGFDGRIRPANGCVQAAQLLKESEELKGCIIPTANVDEVAPLLETDAPVYGAGTLVEAIAIVKDASVFPTAGERDTAITKSEQPGVTLHWNRTGISPVARRAIELAAAGGHPVLLIGAPGSEKSTTAKALSELLPPMTPDEALEVAKVYSVSGRTASRYLDGFRIRPFRAPHASISIAALLGGGTRDSVEPGEVSLAHNGVLFLDEFAEMPKSVIEALRRPVEDKKVVISRLKSKVEYPADFLLAVATNPCPCGYYGEDDRCRCTENQRRLYLSRLSSPIADKLTIQIWMHPEKPGTESPQPEDINIVRERVRKARKIQRKRYEGKPYSLNDEVPASDLDAYCPLDEGCRQLMESLINRLGLSARAYTKILRIARTIADIDGSDTILTQHLAEAASYRFLERRNS